MALKKLVKNKQGYEGEYHVILDYSKDSFFVTTYKDKSVADQTKATDGSEHDAYDLFGMQRSYTIPEGLLNEESLKKEGSSPKVLLYNYWKTLTDIDYPMADAADV